MNTYSWRPCTLIIARAAEHYQKKGFSRRKKKNQADEAFFRRLKWTLADDIFLRRLTEIFVGYGKL